MTVSLCPDRVQQRGRVEWTDDPELPPYAVFDDDGSRVEVYDDFLLVMDGVSGPREWVAVYAAHLLLWQRWLWATGTTAKAPHGHLGDFLNWAAPYSLAMRTDVEDTVLAFLDMEDIGYGRRDPLWNYTS